MNKGKILATVPQINHPNIEIYETDPGDGKPHYISLYQHLRGGYDELIELSFDAVATLVSTLHELHRPYVMLNQSRRT